MKSNDDIRRLLRDTDPAENHELPQAGRARMRAVITTAALSGRRRRSYAPLFAAGAALAMAVIVLIVLIPRGERGRVVTEAPPKIEARATTRIVFTAPQGTKIIWFVGRPTRRS